MDIGISILVFVTYSIILFMLIVTAIFTILYTFQFTLEQVNKCFHSKHCSRLIKRIDEI